MSMCYEMILCEECKRVDIDDAPVGCLVLHVLAREFAVLEQRYESCKHLFKTLQNVNAQTNQSPTSGGARSISSNTTSFPVITATARAPGCHLNSPGVSVQLQQGTFEQNVTK